MQRQLEEAAKANDALLQTRNDRWYPTFHIAARAGWINDPNGLCYFQGRHHVFFQHHPAGTEWGPMHWGHVSSEDLLTWRREAIALAPSFPGDADGVFSGSAVVDDDGVLNLIYTGNAWGPGGPDSEGSRQCQMLATSTDGVTFEKQGVIIESPDKADFRDPKVWRESGVWQMVVAARSDENRGQVWRYSSSDLRNWTFERIEYEDPDPNVYMLECPDLFELDGKWVLIYSPMTTARSTGYASRNGHNCGYVIGDWSLEEGFTPETDFTPIDWGHEFYAPQTYLAPDGRRIMYGWMGGFTVPLASQAHDGWSGQLTVPRELSIGPDGLLRAVPVSECDELRLTTEDCGPVNLGVSEEKVLVSADEGAEGVEIELEIDLAHTTAEQVGLNIHRTDQGGATWVAYDDLSRRVVVDRRTGAELNTGYRSAPVPESAGAGIEGKRGTLKLRVLVDRGSVEVFIGEGEYTISSFSFPVDGPRSLSIVSVMGETALTSLKVHRLGTIWAEPDR